MEERIETIAARLEGVPAYLTESREQLAEPVRLWCDVAVARARRLPELFSTVVAVAARDPLRGRLERAAVSASEAAEDFAGWLEADVLPRATDDSPRSPHPRAPPAEEGERSQRSSCWSQRSTPSTS